MAFFKRFSGFLKEYRVIAISVAFIIGMVGFNFIQSFVNDIILPLIRPLFPSQFVRWEDIAFSIGSANIRIGSFMSSFLNLLLVLVLLFIFVDMILKWKPKKYSP
jgi:large conductance mechanosensitive channel